jgi:predicted double-glycine peptidase
MKSTLCGVAAVAIALEASACFTSPNGSGAVGAEPDFALPANVVPVPIVAQQTDFTGGDVATLALLRYWQNAIYASVPETSLYALLHTTSVNGTEPYDIATYLNGLPGMTATYVTAANGTQLSDLEAAVDRREPPIVDIQAWDSTPGAWSGDWSDGQYAVMVGYDADNLYFMDPSTVGHYGYIARADLAARWHDVVGADGVPTYRMAIFVHGGSSPYTGTQFPPFASAIP